jgi:hypothetical protein
MSVQTVDLTKPTYPPAGSALTVMDATTTTVWLFGEIDHAMADELAQIATHAATPEVILELGRVTFADSSLANFVAVLSQDASVTVKRAARQIVELLTVTGLGTVVSRG